MSNNIIFQNVRDDNEQTRISNEIVRNNNELMRSQSEMNRMTKFNEFQNDVIEINKNEDMRIANEKDRISKSEAMEQAFNDLFVAAKDSDLANTINSEVIGARGGYSNLNNRLGNYDEVLKNINNQISDILYKPISILSLTNDKNVVEIGSILTRVVLSWNLNKNPSKQKVDNQEIDNILREYAIEKSITKDTTFTLEVTDERGTKATKQTSITFLNGIYYGVSDVDIKDSQGILNLSNKVLSNSKNRNINVNCGNGQYIYYCLPNRLGNCKFVVGGFEGGFNKTKTISFKNSKGYTENYDIWKSTNTNLGNTNINIA